MLSKVKNKKHFAKGKRSVVYIGELNKKKVIIKKQSKNSSKEHAIKDEVKWLRRLNKHRLGPKLISEGKDYVIVEFIKGKPILEFLETADKKSIEKVIQKIINKCKTLDSLKINKKEMHKPLKHIIINRNNPRFIDFERAKFTERPKNITQFCQFLTSKKVSDILKNKGIIINKATLRKFLKNYKSR